VRRNPLTSQATDAQIHTAVKKWLRGAGDRDGGRTQRARKAFEAQRHKRVRGPSHHASANVDSDGSRSPVDDTEM